MISNTTKELINLAILKLRLGNPIKETINEATNYLKAAILQIKKEKEPQKYKVWLFNGVLDDNYIEDSYVNCKNGGFESQMTGYEDLVNNKNKLQNNAYIYYKDNLYRNIRAAGAIDMENPPTHTQGVATCGEVELEFVDKIAMAKLIGIE